MSGIYGGTSSAGDAASTTSATQIANTQAAQNSIDSAFSGFNDAWYSKKRTAYLNYAIPELTSQYASERKNLIYGLANKGLVNSTAATEQFTNLNKALTSKEQDVVNSAETAEQNLKTQIATAKSNLYSQISSATSPSSTAQSAISTASSYSSPSYSTISSNAFSDFNTALTNRYSLSDLGGSGSSSSSSTTYTNEPTVSTEDSTAYSVN